MGGYEIPSREESKSKSDYTPLKEGLYILKILGIDLVDRPKWNQAAGAFNSSEHELQYKAVFIPYSKADGRPILDIKGEEVPPLLRWVNKDFSPTSMGFNKEGNASFMRSIICRMTGQEIDGRVKPPNFIVVSPDKKIKTDEKVRQAVLAEHISITKGDNQPTPFHDKGYQLVPDIRQFVGKYIQGKIVVKYDAEKRPSGNNITDLHELPMNCNPQDNLEQLAKSQASYEKSRANQRPGVTLILEEGKAVKRDAELEEEVAMDDIAL